MLPEINADCIPQFDSLIELGTDDPDYGDPVGWPAWVDADRWEPNEPESFEPSQEDVAWLNEQPTLDDWLEYRAWTAWVEERDQERRIIEADIRACGLAVG